MRNPSNQIAAQSARQEPHFLTAICNHRSTRDRLTARDHFRESDHLAGFGRVLARHHLRTPDHVFDFLFFFLSDTAGTPYTLVEPYFLQSSSECQRKNKPYLTCSLIPAFPVLRVWIRQGAANQERTDSITKMPGFQPHGATLEP